MSQVHRIDRTDVHRLAMFCPRRVRGAEFIIACFIGRGVGGRSTLSGV